MASPVFASGHSATLKQGSKRMEQITPHKPSLTTKCSYNHASIRSTKQRRGTALNSEASDHAARVAKIGAKEGCRKHTRRSIRPRR